ncbi:MAG: nucleoside deaminase [Bacteroidales bacterium]
MAGNGPFKRIFFYFMLAFFLVAVLQSRIFQLKPKAGINPEQKREVINLAARSLGSLDVPVGAIVTYEGSIIGRGYNTVQSDSNVAGHAEINAINNAVRKLGLRTFANLDRDKLILYSTFEPCEMCKGAILHYNIERVRFMKDKSPMYWNKVQLKSFDYELHKRRISGEKSQDSLFNLHPEFPGRK